MNLGLESSLTLRRLLVWTYDPKIRLKTLAALVDHCQGYSASPGPLLCQRGFGERHLRLFSACSCVSFRMLVTSRLVDNLRGDNQLRTRPCLCICGSLIFH